MTVVLLAVAGGVGALVRAEWTRWAAARWPGAAWGTRGVNLVGATALALLVLASPEPSVRDVLGMGFLGGMTTFSTWMLDADDRGGPDALREIALTLVPALLVVAGVLAAR